MIIGARVFLFSQVKADVQFWQSDCSAWWYTQFRNHSSIPPAILYELNGSQWGQLSNLDLNTQPKDPLAGPDNSTYVFPQYLTNGQNGGVAPPLSWQTVVWNDSLGLLNRPQPGPDEANITNGFTLMLLLAMLALPGNPPLPMLPKDSRLFGDNLLGHRNAHGCNVTITAKGPRSPEYENAIGTGLFGWVAPQYEDLSFGSRVNIEFTSQRIKFDQSL